MPAEQRTRPSIAFRYDFRAPGFGDPYADLLAAALDQVAYAETRGVERVQISEHHHAEDGYCPSPLAVAAAFAARTKEITIRLNALILPLHDLVRVAEDLAVVDNLSRGRLHAVVAGGYRSIEFEMFGKEFATRQRRVAEGVRFLRAAWSGEPTTFEGKPVLVRPRPFREGGPPLLLGGAGPKAARLAAEIADGFDPAVTAVAADYLAACRELGRDPGICFPKTGPFFVHVSTDPERDKALLGPYVQHEQRMYASWDAKSSHFGSDPKVALERVWEAGSHVVLTPEECVTLVESLDPAGAFVLHPLAGGLPVDAANDSVDLFCTKVLPALGIGATRGIESSSA